MEVYTHINPHHLAVFVILGASVCLQLGFYGHFSFNLNFKKPFVHVSLATLYHVTHGTSIYKSVMIDQTNRSAIAKWRVEYRLSGINMRPVIKHLMICILDLYHNYIVLGL